jgi:hypothetical protein
MQSNDRSADCGADAAQSSQQDLFQITSLKIHSLSYTQAALAIS